MKRKHCVSIAILALLLGSLSITCGEVNSISDSENTGDPIWTINGIISSADPAVAEKADMSDLKAAVVWENKISDTANVAQEFTIGSEFPIYVQIEIFDLPPEEAIHDMAEEGFPSIFEAWWDEEVDGEAVPQPVFSWAEGRLVIYEDRNDNGELDIVKSGSEIVDYVAGGALNYQLFYLESDEEIPLPKRPDIVKGLNVFPVRDAEWWTETTIPISEQLELIVVDSENNQKTMCSGYHFDNHYPSDLYTIPLEVPCEIIAHEQLPEKFPGGIDILHDGKCSGDGGRIFEWCDLTTAPTEDICEKYSPEIVKLYVSTIAEGEPVPEYWPCSSDLVYDLSFVQDFVEIMEVVTEGECVELVETL